MFISILLQNTNQISFKVADKHSERAVFALPVTNLMSDGNPQVKACVLGDHTAPLATASSTQLCYTSDLFIPIGQHQVIPAGAR